MRLISDDILIDSGQESPTFDAVYPMLEGFRFWDPAAWKGGHPFDMYRNMREQAPVMWSRVDRDVLSGFWSVTRYHDIKEVELAHKLFSSQRGSINMAIPERQYWRPDKLMPAALNSLINLDAFLIIDDSIFQRSDGMLELVHLSI